MDSSSKSTNLRRPRSVQRTHSASSLRRPSLKRSSSLNSSKKIELFSGDEYNDDIPWLGVVLDNTLPIDYFKQDLISILQLMKIPKWSKINSNDEKNLKEICIDRISGALTNSIYKISYKKHYPILLRIYGTNADSIIDREKELETLAKLSKKNIGPKLLGFFTNGRFEQFLNNSITLSAKQIRDPKVSRIIARRMKELHLGITLESEDKINGPTSWQTIDKWLNILNEISSKMSHKEQVETFSVGFDQFTNFVNRYKNFLYQRYNNGLNFFSELVFCHNDTQYGNLLFYNPEEDDLLDEIVSTTDELSLENVSLTNLSNMKKLQDLTKFDKKLVVIDFEYSGSNVPLYDITNHFSEWMFDYNDPKTSYISNGSKYPSKRERLNFIKSYYQYDPKEGNQHHQQQQKHQPEIFDKEAEEQIKKLYNDCIYWRATNCIFWALWAIVKEKETFDEPKEILEVGPNGEKYLIKEVEDETDVTFVEEENGFGSKNSDDDFDYINYAGEKISIFIADLIQLGVIEKDEIDLQTVNVKYLDCELL